MRTATTAARSELSSSRTTRRLLVCDTDHGNRQHLERSLTSAGYNVVAQAENGRQANSLADALHPDLVIIEARVLTTGGILSAMEMQERWLVPVILLAGPDEPTVTEVAIAVGAMAIVPLPFTGPTLLAAIEIASARYAEVAALRDQVTDVAERLEAHTTIARAKSILMTRQRMSEQEAHRWIQRTAMNRRITMSSVAGTVISSAASGHSSPGETLATDTVPAVLTTTARYSDNDPGRHDLIGVDKTGGQRLADRLDVVPRARRPPCLSDPG